MRRGAGVLTALVVLVFVPGCGGEDDPTPRTEPTSKADSLGPEVELLDPGAAPRQKVRFALHAGDKSHRTMTLDMTMAMGLDGRPAQTVKVPSMSMGMALEITDVDEELFSSTFSYDDVYVHGTGADAKELEKKLEPIVGVTGELRSTSRGAVVDADLTIPEDADPLMKSTLQSFDTQMQNLAVPFPVEAVGVGARWKVRTHAEINGIRSNAVYTYRLVSRDGDRVKLEFSAEQDAPEQDPDIPGMPDGATAHVSTMGGSGTGRVVVDLGSQLPLTLNSTMKVHAEMKVEHDGASQEFVQDMKAGVSMDSNRKVGAPT